MFNTIFIHNNEWNVCKRQDLFMKYNASAATKSKMAIFSIKVMVKVIDLGIIWKG